MTGVSLYAALVAFGVFTGVAAGLLGVGGGIMMVPFLTFAAGLSQHQAEATSLLVYWARYPQREAHAMSLGAIIPISVVGVATYGIAGKVRWADAAALAIGAIVGARMGAGLLARIDERLLKLVFGLFLVVVSILMGLRA